MRLPTAAHTRYPWRIHEITRDFRLEDVWALPTPGGCDDFPRLVQLMATFDPSQSSSAVVRLLFAVRWKIGDLLGWDAVDGADAATTTLRGRLPPDLRARPRGPALRDSPFTALYLTDDEWALEIANRTVHGVLHLSWVEDDAGGHRGQLAIYVKRNGRLGAAYMTAIAPFRYLIVYPVMLRQIARTWRAAKPTGSAGLDA